MHENEKTKAYSYEITEIELLEGTTYDEINPRTRTTDNSISAANLLKGVKKNNSEEYILPKSSKIVDESGVPLKVYHGTDEEFNAFDWTKGRMSMDIAGIFFTPSEREAKYYGKNVKAFYLNIKNPAPASVAYVIFDKYMDKDYAGAITRQELLSMGYDGVDMDGEEYIAFNPNQIKSAEPVTRVGNGNIIPLSERFSESDDIRYQLTRRNSETIDRLLAKNLAIDAKGVAAFKTSKLPGKRVEMRAKKRARQQLPKP